MTTMTTETVAITIDAPLRQVATDLADPARHPDWATEFFSGPARKTDEDWVVPVPRMGGDARLKIEADVATGRIDMFLAPLGAPFGPPLPVRVVPNGDGCDVLFTLARFPGQDDETWDSGLASMRRELEQLRALYEND
ncbi:MAG: hypothetical protein ACC726_01130 [Chloroflexota bacterium]